MEGVVLQTYGAGNVPDQETNSYLFEELKAACERGVVIVNCTQCTSGVVTELYAGGIVSVIVTYQVVIGEIISVTLCCRNYSRQELCLEWT